MRKTPLFEAQRSWALLAALALAGAGPAHAQAPSAPSSPSPPALTSPGAPGSSLTPGGPRPPGSPVPADAASPRAPPPAIAPPAPQAPKVAPLAPPVTPNVLSGGAASQRGASVLAPGTPGQSAPSTPGGGGKTLEDCMRFWEPATHMTKREWRAACRRTLHRIQ